MSKVAVGVESYTSPDGTVTPTAITWHDGRRWPVEVEVAEKWGDPRAVGVQGWRWRVKLMPGGQRKWLWYEYDQMSHAMRFFVKVDDEAVMDNALRKAKEQMRRDARDGYIQRPWVYSEPEDPDPDAYGWEPDGWC